MVFGTNVVASCGSFEPCGPQPWPAEARKHPAVAGRAPQAASAPPRQPYFVILSEAKNLFPCEPKAACGLCRARRRKTNEVQSRIYFGQGYRFFVAMLLRMTNYLIVRKLRSRLGYATGGNAERWKEKMFGAVAACRGKHRLLAVRAEAPPRGGSQILAPPASAREHLCYRSTASDKKPVPVSLPNQNRKLAATRATLRIVKPQNDKNRRKKRPTKQTIPYTHHVITPPADC